MAAISYAMRSGSWSASDSAPGYPASNLGIPRVGRPWRSNFLGSITVQIDLGSTVSIDPVLVIMGHNANPGGFQVHSSLNGSTWANEGAGTNSTGISGLRKGLFRKGSNISFRYLRVTFTGGTVDGAISFQCGYAMLFSAHADLAAPLYGANARLVWPQWSTSLPNGLDVRADAGEPFTEIRLPWRQAGNQVAIERLAERARREPVLLDLQLPDRSGWWWIVRNHQAQLERNITGHNRENTQLVLAEVV